MESSWGKMGDFRANWKAKRAESWLQNKNKQKIIAVESNSVIFEEAWNILIKGDCDSAYHYECMILYSTLVTDLGKKSEINWNTGILGNSLCTSKAELGQGEFGLMRCNFSKTCPRAVSIARPSTLSQMTSLSHTIVLLADVYLIQMQSWTLTA